MSDERTPLLQSHSYQHHEDSNDPHEQFCALVGVPSSEPPPGAAAPTPRPTSLYTRATRERRKQNITYLFTASLSNTLLLTQVVLGATLTALGASKSSHVLITVFGVINTVIAGLVAYLKSRGQPMRARMFRDDMDRVVDEIENSEVMWLGISKGMLGYTELSADEEVTVRSEVARLTRLYDRAVKTNTMNNPDIYSVSATQEGGQNGSKTRLGQTASPTVPSSAPAAILVDGHPAPLPGAVVPPDPDESPATKPPPTPQPPALPAVDASTETPEVSSSAADKQVDRDDPSHDEAPKKPKASRAGAPPDSTQAAPSAESTRTTANPAAASDDILDDPDNPTIRSGARKPAPNSTSK